APPPHRPQSAVADPRRWTGLRADGRKVPLPQPDGVGPRAWATPRSDAKDPGPPVCMGTTRAGLRATTGRCRTARVLQGAFDGHDHEAGASQDTRRCLLGNTAPA